MERPISTDSPYNGYLVGQVLSLEALSGKLKKRQVDIGQENPLTIVTNAPNVRENSRVIVATVGSIVNGEEVKAVSVGGCKSHGMLCDAPMLGWAGGGAGTAVSSRTLNFLFFDDICGMKIQNTRH